jgi:transcriptional regulator with XRE-family HTH domain
MDQGGPTQNDKPKKHDPVLCAKIAARLLQIRGGIKTGDLIQRSGISRAGIAKMENAKISNPSVYFLSLYLKACKSTFFEFFDHPQWMPPQDEKAKREHIQRRVERILKNPKTRKGFMAVLDQFDD